MSVRRHCVFQRVIICTVAAKQAHRPERSSIFDSAQDRPVLATMDNDQADPAGVAR
jgi:hypothetical protein